MKRSKSFSGKAYFYTRGQSARSRGLSKAAAEAFYHIHTVPDYARIAFDMGYRGL